MKYFDSKTISSPRHNIMTPYVKMQKLEKKKLQWTKFEIKHSGSLAL